MKYSRVAATALLAAAATAAGCGSARPADPVDPVDCEIDVVRIETEPTGGPTITTVRAATATGDGELELTTIRDEPVRPSLTWRSDAPLPDQLVLDQVGTQHGEELMVGPSPGITEIDDFLSGLPDEPGRYVGYASVNRQDAWLAVRCGAGDEAQGVLATWTTPGIGAVSCALELESDAPPEAAAAQREFC